MPNTFKKNNRVRVYGRDPKTNPNALGRVVKVQGDYVFLTNLNSPYYGTMRSTKFHYTQVLLDDGQVQSSCETTPGNKRGYAIKFGVSNDGGKTSVAWRNDAHAAFDYLDLQNAGGPTNYCVVAVRLYPTGDQQPTISSITHGESRQSKRPSLAVWRWVQHLVRRLSAWVLCDELQLQQNVNKDAQALIDALLRGERADAYFGYGRDGQASNYRDELKWSLRELNTNQTTNQ